MAPSAPAGAGAALAALERVWEAQAGRVDTYRDLGAAFEALVAGGPASAYEQAVGSCTERFAGLSLGVNAAEAELREGGFGAEADLVRRVQESEREKLQLTCTLHVLKQAHSRGEWSWQRGEGAGPAPLRPDWARGRCVAPGAAHAAGGAAAAACGCGSAAEPTEDEYRSAVQEATQGLQAAVEGVNEALEELRYAREEILEGEG